MNTDQFSTAPPDRRRELVTRHLPPKNKEEGFEAFIPIEAESGEADRLFALHAAACLGKKGERGLREMLDDPKTHAGLQAVLDSVGAYNRKSPNANVGAGPLFGLPPGSDATLPPGASSRTAPCFRRVGSAGNAAYAAFMSFFAKEYGIDGANRSVAEDFAARGPLWAAAVAAGLPQAVADALAERLRAKVEQPETAPIDRFLKQIHWPTEDGGYCLLSPVQSFGILGETALRLDRIVRKERHILGREYVKVGGANAINAGQLNAEIAGRQPHLLCLPPKPRAPQGYGEDWLESRLARLAHRGTVFGQHTIKQETAEAIQSGIDDPRQNAAAKRRFESVLRYAAEEAIEEAAVLSECLQAQTFVRLREERFDAVPAALKAWLDPRSLGLPEDAPLDRDSLRELAEQIREQVFDPWQTDRLAGAELRMALTAAIREAL
jgi:hypothetical protein